MTKVDFGGKGGHWRKAKNKKQNKMEIESLQEGVSFEVKY